MKLVIQDNQLTLVEDVNFDLFSGAGGRLAQNILSDLQKIGFQLATLPRTNKILVPEARTKAEQASKVFNSARKSYDRAINFTRTAREDFDKKTAEKKRRKDIGLSDGNTELTSVANELERVIQDLQRSSDNFFRLFGKDKIKAVIREATKALRLLHEAETIQVRI